MNMNVAELMAKLKAEGKNDNEIAKAVAEAYNAEVQRVKAEEEAKRRERLIEIARQKIRQDIFKGMKLVKSQQIAYLYQYAKENAETMRAEIQKMVDANKQEKQ